MVALQQIHIDLFWFDPLEHEFYSHKDERDNVHG